MIAVTLAVALAQAPAEADIGPQPTMEEFVALAEPALASKVRGRRSVKFTWPYQLVAGPAGYYTCGRVDAHKRKGREGVWVSAVVARGQVVNSQWSTRNGMLAWQCKREVSKGTLLAR